MFFKCFLHPVTMISITQHQSYLSSLKERLISGLLSVWLHHVACGILVPQPGIEPAPLAMKDWSSNHWTVREFPSPYSLN